MLCELVIVVWVKMSIVSITCGFRKYCLSSTLGDVKMICRAFQRLRKCSYEAVTFLQPIVGLLAFRLSDLRS